MTQEEKSLTMHDYMTIALRRKWYIGAAFLVGISITIALYLFLPDMYKASTTILVIPQEVPDEFVKSTVTMNPSQYLNVIAQEILSRTRLETIVHEIFKPSPDRSLEKIIDGMRDNIEIDVNLNKNKGVSSFTIAYIGPDPVIVARVANRIASLFIEENLKNRESQAKKTTLFLKDELEKLETVLVELENKITAFKQKHIGSLPEQRDSNLKMLDQLILQRQRVADELNAVKNRSILFQKQLLQAEALVSAAVSTERGAAAAAAAPLPLRISDAKRRLTELQNRYTDDHPDVIATKVELQKLIAHSNALPADDQGAQDTASAENDRQLLAFRLEIEALNNEDAALRAKIADYQQRVEMAPRLEQELGALTRDYQNTKNAYDLLTKKRLEAEQAEKLEIKQQGEQFRVLDPATVPSKPFKPDRLKIAALGFLLSLALGAGLAGLVEYLDQSFHSVKDLEASSGISVLAVIPVHQSALRAKTK